MRRKEKRIPEKRKKDCREKKKGAEDKAAPIHTRIYNQLLFLWKLSFPLQTYENKMKTHWFKLVQMQLGGQKMSVTPVNGLSPAADRGDPPTMKTAINISRDGRHAKL